MGLLGNITGQSLGAIGASFVQGIYNNRAVDNTNKANLDLAQYQYSKDLEMWNKQNEYNSPIMQMQRFTDAGLNPNLIYGQGNAGNASSAPSFNRPEMRPKQLDLGNIVALASMYQDLSLKESATAKNEAEKDRIDTLTRIAKIDEAYKTAVQNFRINLAKWNTNNAQIKYGINQMQKDLKKYELDYIFPARKNLLHKQEQYYENKNKWIDIGPDNTPWLVRMLLGHTKGAINNANNPNSFLNRQLRLQNPAYGK